MSVELLAKLDKLRADYRHIKGQPFTYFFCPILFRDEDVPLCKAHIVNLAFPDSSRDWTIQRKDVDNFYGSIFEAEFITLKYKGGQILGNTITDKKLSKVYKPMILIDDEPVEFFVANDNIPKQFTLMDFDNDGQLIRLGLKLSPEDALATTGRKWEIAISKDLRLPALVSLIKAAHLTLFEMIGYQYALSTGGYFVGRHILGEFFLQNLDKPKPDVLENAYPFFKEFAHMVRPVQSSRNEFQGTITDRLLLICKEDNGPPWAFIVFIKTSQSLHAVMIPILDQPDMVAKFLQFLQDDNEFILITLTRFEQDHWTINKESDKLTWPKSGILYV